MENITAIKKGDVGAFTDVFEELHKKVFTFFMGRTQRNKELSKELTQLTFIKAWQSRHTLSETHTIDRQLFVIAKSTLVDFIRKDISERNMKQALQEQNQVLQRNHDEQVHRFEKNEPVLSILKKLPPARKRILHMKYVNGYSNREIAEMLSISVKTVEDHVTKGLREIKTNPNLSAVYTLLFFISSQYS